MLTISQARKSANQVKQVNVVARARKTSSHCGEIESLQPTPKFPSPKAKTTSEKEARQRAAAQKP